jgi:N-acetyl-anhydromuramyl-L-alanine amidase AmpD
MKDMAGSKLAIEVASMRKGSLRPNPIPFGLMVHTTGRTLVTRAQENRQTPMERAVRVYSRGPFPHYVIDWSGKLVQIAGEEIRAAHAGISRKEARQYKEGHWVNNVSKTALERWRSRWRDFETPLDLFPGRSPNSAYIGVELIPQLTADEDTGSWFTEEQYQMVAYLADDLSVRYGISLEDNRLVGHEDVEPLSRWNRAGGWDPGAMRAQPRFLWSQVRRWRTI